MNLPTSSGQVEQLLPVLLSFDTLEQIRDLNLPFLAPVETLKEICRQEMKKDTKKNPVEGIPFTWTTKELESFC
jgi:hypothetical protein